MDPSCRFTSPSGTIKRISSPTLCNLAPIPSSPRTDIDRCWFCAWCVPLVPVKKAEGPKPRAPDEVTQLTGTVEAVNVGCQDA